MRAAIQTVARLNWLVAGLLAAWAMWTLSATPLVWHWMGRPPEAYPELLFVAFGLGPAWVAVMAGAVIAWRPRALAERPWLMNTAKVVAAAGLLPCLLLSFWALFEWVGSRP